MLWLRPRISKRVRRSVGRSVANAFVKSNVLFLFLEDYSSELGITAVGLLIIDKIGSCTVVAVAFSHNRLLSIGVHASP